MIYRAGKAAVGVHLDVSKGDKLIQVSILYSDTHTVLCLCIRAKVCSKLIDSNSGGSKQIMTTNLKLCIF